MLSGELPSTLGSCLGLEVLHLQGNYFNGTIPSSMVSLRGVQDFATISQVKFHNF